MSKPVVLREVQREIEALFETQSGAPLTRAARARLARTLAPLGATLKNPARPEQFASREVTILLADLRGFSALSATYPAGVILQALNHYVAAMSEIIVREGGMIDKLMGDSVMAIFSGPDAVQAVRGALRCAVKMQLSMDALNRRCRSDGLPELYMGIGVNTGTVMAGNVGSALYSEYTVIGETVNLVSRIEAFCLRGQILASESTYLLADGYVRAGDAIEVYVKGKDQPVNLREVRAIPSLRHKVPLREIRRSVRVKADVPLKYRLMNGKIVESRAYKGRAIDLGYFGFQIELSHAVRLHEELKLEIDLPLVSYQANDIYARVQRVRPAGNRTLANLEISSASEQTLAQLRRFVQLLVQGRELV